MAVNLNERALRYAAHLITEGRFVFDDRDAWSEHRPSTADENRFIERRGIDEYGRWHLGTDDDAAKETKSHYKFPYGDFENVHRCALLAAESRAGQRSYDDIARAVAHLHGMTDALHAAARAHR